MPPIPLSLVVEDALSEAVCLRVIKETNRNYEISTVYNRGGNSWIRAKILGFNQAARGIPFLVLTDLDQADCPQTLRLSWLNGQVMSPNLIFRIATREVEAWLLADRDSLASFLRVRRVLLNSTPEQLPDPKQFLINAARNSTSRKIREGIVPTQGTTARIGPDYNGILTQFVFQRWNLATAVQNSDSLRRFSERLNSFTPTWAQP